MHLPEPFYEDAGVVIYHAKNEDILPLLAPESFHAVVTDPPYDLTTGGKSRSGFMGLAWDGTGIAFDPAFWRLVAAVLKPGGYCLAFGGTRTHHRMICAIEDAGFEIRDMLAWVHGQGFPKSLNVSKQLDAFLLTGKSSYVAMADIEDSKGAAVGRPDEPYHSYAASESESRQGKLRHGVRRTATDPITDAGKQWAGFGSALKPALEPICLARKPLTGTICENILEHGCGALNIDASRIETDTSTARSSGINQGVYGADNRHGMVRGGSELGRFPSNLLHDGSPEVLAEFDKAGERTSRKTTIGTQPTTGAVYGRYNNGRSLVSYPSTGSAARFFFCAKSSKSEREENLGDMIPQARGMSGGAQGKEAYDKAQSIGLNRIAQRRNTHATVKPLALMAYLIRLITPPGGIVLDPFMGSGSTLVSAQALGFRCVGIEQDITYCEIAARRLRQRILPFAPTQREEKPPVPPAPQPTLFTDPE